jgi:hypothetical protein
LDMTNEEKRVPLYATSTAPTIPSTVSAETPLESLNMNWRERDLPEKDRTKHVHRLHPYLGKYIPQLVEIFLRKYFKLGQTVLDPFCGSGTTLVQANELGINGIGYDISAFNIMLCHAKLYKYNLRKAKNEVLDVLDKLSEFDNHYGQRKLLLNNPLSFTIPENDNLYLEEWFSPRALKELLAYRYLIESGDYEYKDLLRVILSRSARSARLTTHFDLDFPKRPQNGPYWCHKHSRTCCPVTEADKFLKRYSIDTLKRIEEFSKLRTDATVELHHDDSRTSHFPAISGIITSPPYVGLIDYHEQHAYAYHLLGLEDRRGAEIGAAKKGTNRTAQQLYQRGIVDVFKNAVDSMPTGGRLIVVVHDKSNLYYAIAKMCGVEIEAVVDRHVNRRTGRRFSEFFESVFVWRKS